MGNTPIFSIDENIDRIQTDILFDISADSSENSYKIADTYLGSIAGFLSSLGNTECSNLAGYMTALFPDYGNFYAGALGCTQVSSQHSSEIKLNSVFSEVKVNRTPVVSKDNKLSSVTYAPYAMIGQVLQGKNIDGTCTSGGYEFKNLYGCVKLTDKNAGFSVPFYELYDLPEYAIYSETDCIGCDTLPDSCGFDTEIWDISDRIIPILK